MDTSSSIRSAGDDLFLISLPVPITGFEGFITAWVYTGGPVVLVDVGPSSTKDFLLAALEDIGVRRLDYILLTHVHIDHSGAAGDIARAFPQTPVVCHPKASEHLIDPQRLWEGSLKALGEVARQYGRISPVSAAQVIAADQLQVPGVLAVPTPGHAPHHYSYAIGDTLFAGEAGGVCISLNARRFYMRPATPPRFILEIYLESIDRLIAMRPQQICYGHIGRQSAAVAMLDTHREQLRRWYRMLKPWSDAVPPADDAPLADCLTHLLENDPLLSGFFQLPEEARERERFFLMNSLRGYWGYLKDRR